MTSAKWQPFCLDLNVLSGDYNFRAHACAYIPHGPIHNKSGLEGLMVVWPQATSHDMKQFNMTDIFDGILRLWDGNSLPRSELFTKIQDGEGNKRFEFS